jgi:hypothetical protein
LWEPTRQAYIGNDNQKFPVPLVGFYDKTHTDQKGILSTVLLLKSFTFLNIETRKKLSASFPIGLVLNLNHGDGLMNNSCPNETHLEHNCLTVVLQDNIDIHAIGEEMRIIFGKEKTLIFWFHLIIGDIQGNSSLSALYQNSGLRPYCSCICDFDDLDTEKLSSAYLIPLLNPRNTNKHQPI